MYGPLLCLSIGLSIGVADAVMVRLISGLYKAKMEVLLWAMDHMEIGLVVLPLLGFSLLLTLSAAALVKYVFLLVVVRVRLKIIVLLYFTSGT